MDTYHRYPLFDDAFSKRKVDFEDVNLSVSFGDSFADYSKFNFKVYASADYYHDKSQHFVSGANYQQINISAGAMLAREISKRNGIIISTGSSSSLILTCCHSVAVPSGYSRVSITVEDYLGNSYSASVYQSDGAKVIDPDYDLACVVASGLTGLPAIKFADDDAKLGDTVIALGAPGGQVNAVTIGEVIDFTTVTLGNADPNLSNVTFVVPKHTALIKGGSSGGALLNAELELVGINYAGNDSEFDYGFSVPLSKIREFICLYTGATV